MYLDDQAPILNGQFAAPRDYQDFLRFQPAKRKPRMKHPDLLQPAYIQQWLARAYFEIADHVRANGMPNLANNCETNALIHVRIADAIQARKSHSK